MDNRWQMNRIGFVNFWLYDNESFEFEDGKILLRGQNGSGKSITTQSFIPFILDGDRTPSRLDPFGTSDRKMDYYFLGEGDKDESTGYLYLEFKKQNTDEYRSIGIGQTARRGKPMTFWGFIIKDNRRIGIDLNLYRKSGDKIIPLDKQELKKEIGENNLFTDSQKEYKQLVNENLFRFERIDQYDQFIKLLIKVRAPKLSNDFKPTKVYGILNDSLQVLSDDDLRAMVDAMEKMDSIQENLEGLKRSLTDASQIMKEYEHYNRYMLAKKAHNYLDSDVELQLATSDYEEELKKVESWKLEEKELSNNLNQLNIEKLSIERELEELTDDSIENLDIKYQRIKSDLKDNTDNKDKKENEIQQKREKIRLLEISIKELNDQADFLQKQISDSLKDMDALQEEIQSDFHEEIKRKVQDNEEIDSNLIHSKITTLRNCISQGKKILAETKIAENKYNEAISKEEENNRIYLEKETEYDALNKDKEYEQDVLMNSIDDLTHNEFWYVNQATIEQAKEVIEDYKETNDSIKLRNVLNQDFQAKVQKERENIAVYLAELKQVKEKISQKQIEYQEVQKQKIIEPERDDASIHARKLLNDASIQAYPFYQTIEFSNALNEQEQAILEQQLYKAGILDALVVTNENYQRIQNEFPQLNDVIISESENTGILFEDLIPDSSIDLSIQNVVKNILSHFSKSNGSLILKEDGYFRHGMIEGHATKEESEYIGINARKRKKQQLLLALEEEINNLKCERDDIQEKIEEKNHLIEEMQNEFDSSYDTHKLDGLITKMNQLNLHIQELARKKEQLEKETIQTYNVYKQKEREMLQACSSLPYARTEEEYETILSDLNDYQGYFYTLYSKIKELNSNYETIQMKDNSKEEILEDIDNLSLEKDTLENKIQALNKDLQVVEDKMNNPEIQEKAKKLKETRERQKENQNRQKELGEKLAIIHHDLENADSLVEDKKNKKESIEIKEKYTRKYFEEELALHFVIEENDKSLKDNALEATTREESSYMTKSSDEMTSNLYSVYQKNNSNLSIYNTSIEQYFDSTDEQNLLRTRYVVTSIKSGKKLSLGTFVQELRKSIDVQEELIKEKDRELFEDILSQTISRKLSDKIDESKNWVKEMSNLMKNIDTSMGLSFSLDWKPKNPEDIEEMDVKELEKLLTKDNALVTPEEMTRVSRHFRSIIQREKQRQEMNNEIPNYLDLVRNALDYRQWYEFKMSYRRVNEGKKDLTNAAFNRFSGGERAMAMYVPLFAAVNAQYQKAKALDHPRMIALDEAFAGVDEKNISSMFELVEKLDFDYIMNSQALWGCYATVKKLRICELLRPLNQEYVTVINYTWNGKEKKLDDR